MKLHVMSDIHREHYMDHGHVLIAQLKQMQPKVDALILAGDITSAAKSITWKEDMQDFLDIYTKVFYVPGNHEYYGGGGAQVHSAMLDAAARLGDRFTMLGHEMPPLEFNGRRFLGGTMWFKETPLDWRFSSCISDFRAIRNFVPWVHQQNAAFEQHLIDNLQEGDVVVTHHMPSSQSTPIEFRDEPSNRYFVCDQEKLIAERKPALWIHGHTHQAFNYKLGETRVTCNPRGYPGEIYRHLNIYAPMEVEI